MSIMPPIPTRSMQTRIDNRLLYDSHFDPKTGNIVRRVEMYDHNRYDFRLPHEVQQKLRDKYKHRYHSIPSPSPELIDVSITDKCTFGCSYCYQDSRPRRTHAKKDLIPTLLKGFAQVPYQIAIGGGEPTENPDFVSILHQTRELGTVPNYTTAGHKMTPEIYAATNEVCGGVALTFHAFKGVDYFTETYAAMRKALKVQLNVHVIADKNVSKSLDTLTRLSKTLGAMNVVLLAYSPDVGRATMDLLMTRTVYSRDLPESIVWAKNSGMKIAFSEGLLPYFNSRPELGINTDMAAQSEGNFSCYVDPRGYMWVSSFAASEKPYDKSIFEEPSQKLWEDLRVWGNTPSMGCCSSCDKRGHCTASSQFHASLCAYAPHNKLPLIFKNPRSAYDRLDDED